MRSFACEEAEGELGSAANLGAHAGFATHQFCEAARDRQAKAGAAILARGGVVSLRERAEEATHRLFVHADAGIRDADLDQMLPIGQRLCRHEDLDPALRRELDGVGNQVRDALAHAHSVEIQNLRQVRVERQIEFEPGFLRLRLPQPMQAAQRVREIRVRIHDGDLARFDLREVEHVVEQRHEIAAAVENGLHLLALFARQISHLQHLRHAQNAVQRRADLVAHVGEEGGLGVRRGNGCGLRLLQFPLALAQLGHINRDRDLPAVGHRAIGDLHDAAVGGALFVGLAVVGEGVEILDLLGDLVVGEIRAALARTLYSIASS